MKRQASLWPVMLGSGLGIVILCALGAWQVARLGEKEKLLAELTSRAVAQPISLTEALVREQEGQDTEFTKVAAQGTFDHARELHKQAVYDGGPGWQVIAPLVSNDGVAVLVDRGVMPGNMKNRAIESGPASISGVIRHHDRGQGFFDPENDVAGNIWYWWDVPAMQAQASFPADAKVASFILQALPDAKGPKFPKPEASDAGVRNNHLQYAITWFALAAVLLVITALFMRRERHP
jgi:surfeit locus 1 family protein